MMDYAGFARNTEQIDLSIAATTSVSDTEHLKGCQPIAIELPAAFEATTIRLSFKVGLTSTVDFLRDSDGNVVTVTVAATNTNKRVYLDPAKFCGGWNYIACFAASDTAGTTAVVQSATRAITLIAGKVI